MIFKDNTEAIAKIIATSFEKVTTSYIEQLSKLEAEHWKQLEKQSTKQLQILEKQTKDFMSVMSDFIEASKPTPPPIPHADLLDKVLSGENTIEKEEVEEQNLEDIQRIPLTNGVKVQFEGEELIHDINIS